MSPIGLTVLSVLAKGSLIVAGAGLAAVACRRRSAAVRHAIWTAGLFGVMALPLATVVVPRLELPVLAAPAGPDGSALPSSTDVTSRAPNGVVTRGVGTEGPAANRVASEETATVLESGLPVFTESSGEVRPIPPIDRTGLTGGAEWSVDGVGLAVWLLGVVLGLLWIVVGEVAARRVGRGARPAGAAWSAVDALRRSAGITRRVRVVELEADVVPFTYGWFRPVIVVPRAGAAWSVDHRRDVLAHELAHVRRHDCLTLAVGRLAAAFHWPNPLVWIAIRQARVEREHACDDAVLSSGATPSRYAEELLSTARAMGASLGPAMAGVAMARRSELARRLGSVLDGGRVRAGLSGRSLGATGGVTLAVVLPLAALVPVATRAPTHDTDPRSGLVVLADTLDQARYVAARQPREPRAPRVPGSPIDQPPAPSALAPDRPAAPPRVPSPLASPIVAAPSLSTLPAASASPPPVVPSPPSAPRAPLVASTTRWARISNEVTSAVGLRPAALAQQAAPCPVAKGGNRTVRLNSSMSITGQGTTSDGKDTYTAWTGRDCSVVVHLVGTVRFTTDERDVATLSEGGRLEITHVDGRVEREYRVRSRGGDLERRYTIDGDPAAEDAGFAQWRAAILLAFIRRSGHDAEARTRRLLAQRGPAGVLTEIDQIPSDWAASRYFRALITGVDPDRDLAAEAVTRAGRQIESDFELGRILATIPERLLGEEQVRAAFVGAAATMESDFEMAKVLKGVLTAGRPSPAVVASMLSLAEAIESDFELASVLVALAERGTLVAQTEVAFVEAARSIESDFERHRVLSAFLRGPRSATALATAFELAGGIESDFEAAGWLKEVLGTGAVTPDLAAAFFGAAGGIESDFELAGVLVLAVKQGLARGEHRASVRRLAATIESDHERQRVMAALGERAAEN
jgi:beta-lactamase regulating signal transducer with metallopeptidase domain